MEQQIGTFPSLLSSGDRNGIRGFVGAEVGNAICRTDLPALPFLVSAKPATALIGTDREMWVCGLQ